MAMSLSPEALFTESRNRQFNKDGSVVTSPKGAIGIAQIMPGTGPEAAADAGLPWDPARLKSDPVYNKALGDGHYNKLVRVYNGDEVLATAAYNAGQGRVHHAIAQAAATGKPIGTFLPQETRDYVKKIKGVDVGGASGGMSLSNTLARNLSITPYTPGAPAPGEVDQLAPLPDDTRVAGKPDIAGIRQGLTDVSEKGQAYSTFLDGAVSQVRTAAQAVTENLAGVAETKHSIANDMSTREAALEAKVKPLHDRKAAILDRIDELNSMSPFERRLKSAFNPDYDLRALRGRLGDVETQIKGHEEMYSELNAMREGVAKSLESASDADNAVLGAQASGIQAEASILSQGFQAASTNLSTKLLPGQIDASLARDTLTRKATILGSMSAELLNQAYQNSRTSGTGKVSIQGLDFTVGDLQDASMKATEQQMQFRNLQNATVAGDLQHRDALETYVIAHMTPEQLATAAQNKGMFNGVQLSIPKVVAGMQSANDLRQTQVTNALDQTAVGQFGSTMQNFGQQMKDVSRRSIEMFGNLPGEFHEFGVAMQGQMAAWSRGLEDAKAHGVEDQYRKETLPAMQQYQKLFNDKVDEVALKWGGGKPELAAVASSYLKGNPLSGDAATKGLVILANSGMPAGAKMSGPALSAFKAAQSVVQQWNAGSNVKPGDSFEAMMAGDQKKRNPADLLRKVQSAAGQAYSDAMTESLFSAMPDMARNVRDPNNPNQAHPFAQVDKMDFLHAVQYGDQQSFAVIGKEVGLNDPSLVKAMFAQGPEGSIWQEVKKAKGYKDDSKFTQLMQIAGSVQKSELLSALDASPSAHRMKVLPSKAFVDFLQTPDARNQLDNAVNNYGRSSFGSFVVSSSSAGGYRDNLDGYANELQGTYVQLHSANVAQRIKEQRGLFGDPFVRGAAVLQGAGFTKQDAQTLMQAIKPAAAIPEKSTMEWLGSSMGGMGGNPMYNARQFDAVTQAIKSTKFDDPKLEALRRRAAPLWDDHSRIVDGVADSLRGD